ncbi:hypothetical protein BIW11_09838 [Tropilaelaps mercedesae]|uniref:Uncharacterized protein n=1 Tax=Tropilaelaps mercedesae TaxID=418985 RepID=A0A1V9XIS9_9ACAR|nr:hypothetical protein BIW11_09838 [Tropilaelaps mercedesae]
MQQRSREGSLVNSQTTGQSTTSSGVSAATTVVSSATNSASLGNSALLPTVVTSSSSSLASAMANTAGSASAKNTNSVSFYEEGNQVYPYPQTVDQDSNAMQSPPTPRTTLRASFQRAGVVLGLKLEGPATSEPILRKILIGSEGVFSCTAGSWQTHSSNGTRSCDCLRSLLRPFDKFRPSKRLFRFMSLVPE